MNNRTPFHKVTPFRSALPEVSQFKRLPITLVLDNIRSGNNVGSILRTADAFLIGSVILVGITPAPPNREVLKTALGASETVPWIHLADRNQAIEYIRENKLSLVVAEHTDNSVDLAQFSWQPNLALVLGNEVDGVSEEFINAAGSAVEIPQAGMKHSLNVAVAAGILGWEAFSALK